MSGPLLLLAGLLGGAAACARFAVDAAITARARGRQLPLGILVVNLSGAFLLGVVVGAALHGHRLTLVATGLLGSYTTFSTWMIDTHRLVRDGRPRRAALNLVAGLALGLLAVLLGRALGRAL